MGVVHVIHLDRAVLRDVSMRLKAPFQTSFGTFQDKSFILVELLDKDGVNGWGESVAFAFPWYNEETVETNRHMIEDILLPLLFESPLRHPDEVRERFSAIRRNNMAKSALEGAVWDLYAKKIGMPLAEALGGEKKQIDVGVSIGIQPSTEALLEVISRHVASGYKRIKLKIKPGTDVELLRDVRRHFPEIPLMADANSAYTLNDMDRLKALDDFDLLMIEQPLAHDDLIDHAVLQQQLDTPICLDESIHSYEDVQHAIKLGSCKIINIKIGRVGGLTEAKRIHDLCAEHGIPVWCGGMLEAGVGRAHNIALTTLPQFLLPGDTSASSRYWEADIIEPEVTVTNGIITVPETAGIGYDVDRQQLDRLTKNKKVIING
ncbi:MAG TPA: o-succinylbenzoate synthase [Bacillales bacterium]|nr:o-succinylbenzoate synthase [Bacillales bacterium]